MKYWRMAISPSLKLLNNSVYLFHADEFLEGIECCCQIRRQDFIVTAFVAPPEDVGCIRLRESHGGVLDFSVLDGNDLITPRPNGLPGLKPGTNGASASHVGKLR